MTRSKYTFNISKFHTLDKELAYWLGFIYGDGNIYKKTLSIKLGIQDKDHLEKFRKFAESDYGIDTSKDGKAVRVRLYSDELIDVLNNYNIYPNKTHSLQYPDFLDAELNSHFIRGFFDADGWITKDRICLSSCSSDFIQKIKEIVNQESGYKKGNIVVRRKSLLNPNWKDISILTFAGQQTMRDISNYLHKDASREIYLERKNIDEVKVIEA